MVKGASSTSRYLPVNQYLARSRRLPGIEGPCDHVEWGEVACLRA